MSASNVPIVRTDVNYHRGVKTKSSSELREEKLHVWLKLAGRGSRDTSYYTGPGDHQIKRKKELSLSD